MRRRKVDDRSQNGLQHGRDARATGGVFRERGRVARGAGRGFTLVEVLATIALIAIVLPVAMYGIQLCLQTSSAAKRQAEAATLAEGKLQELVAAEQGMQASGGN